MSDLNLHKLAMSVYRDGSSPDPGDMAKELVRRLEPEQYEAALLETGRMYMRHIITTGRQREDSKHPGTSPKVVGIRDHFARFLDGPEYVPSAKSWVRLREATRTQVLEMAGERVKKARENAAAAKRYEHLAALMVTHHARTPGDLPEQALRSVLEVAA